MRLNRLLSHWVLLEALDGEEDVAFFVSPQNPLTLGEHFEPELDLALARRRVGRAGVPIPEGVLLVVEVTHTSLTYDHETKLPLYAEAGIPEAWLVDPTTDAIEVYSKPGSGGYGGIVRTRCSERLVSATLPELTSDAAEALPPGG